jgi:hypothetical protein
MAEVSAGEVSGVEVGAEEIGADEGRIRESRESELGSWEVGEEPRVRIRCSRFCENQDDLVFGRSCPLSASALRPVPPALLRFSSDLGPD